MQTSSVKLATLFGLKGRSSAVPNSIQMTSSPITPFSEWGTGTDGVKASAASVCMGLPDYREAIKLLIDAGEYIVVELLIEGTHTGPMNGMEATGNRVAFRDVTILSLRDGKIIEQRGPSDYFTMFQLLGVISQLS